MENEEGFVMKELAWSSGDLWRALQGALAMEPGSGQSLLAPHYPSLPARRCWSSPGQAWGHQAVPGVTTADAHPGLGRVPSIPQACPALFVWEQTHSSWGRCHLHQLEPAHSSTHPPSGERGGPLALSLSQELSPTTAMFHSLSTALSKAPVMLFPSHCRSQTTPPDNACVTGGSHRPLSIRLMRLFCFLGLVRPTHSLSCIVYMWHGFCKHWCALLLLWFENQ